MRKISGRKTPKIGVDNKPRLDDISYPTGLVGERQRHAKTPVVIEPSLQEKRFEGALEQDNGFRSIENTSDKNIMKFLLEVLQDARLIHQAYKRMSSYDNSGTKSQKDKRKKGSHRRRSRENWEKTLKKRKPFKATTNELPVLLSRLYKGFAEFQPVSLNRSGQLYAKNM